MLETFARGLIQREFDEPLPNPSPRRGGAEIFLVSNEKIRVSKPLSLWGRGLERGFYSRRTHVNTVQLRLDPP
ncbi:hypothetical protein NIES25_41990 [Nostoc linckia NIES-25]|nr:hypothetical protein NIES25_41990 [Nostoc linckia NIES-25]